MKHKFLSFLLFGAMLIVFSACEQRTTTTEVYQVILVTDDLKGATAKASKINDVHFADEVRVTITPEKSHAWEIAPEVTASNAICKSSTEEEGVHMYVFTAFEDNSVIQVTGVAVFSNDDNPYAGNAAGTHRGHDYVGLSLPSGTLWATCNVGATNPEDYGDYFAWGETIPKSTYNWTTYKYGSDIYELTKYCTTSYHGKNGFIDNKTVLESSDDAASVNWGGNWRMPTKEEQDELRTECTWTWTTINGVKGYKVSSKVTSNTNYIFLPAAGSYNYSDFTSAGYIGSYWSSSLRLDRPYSAYGFVLDSDSYDRHYAYRLWGYTVRPVYSPR